jgi:exosortase
MNQLAQRDDALTPAARSRPEDAENNTAPAVNRTRKHLAVVAALLLLGHLPLLVEHFLNLWARPHYQFVVFLPVLVWLLASQRLRDTLAPDNQSDEGHLPYRPGSIFLWGPLLLVSFTTLLTATYLHSPWLGMLSALLTCLASTLAIGGVQLLRALFPAWLLMAMALPLPSNLDVRLITSLREITTHFSSVVLDEFGILHLVSGNVIELPEQSLFIADACTGIHSLFVLLTCALFVGLWMRRGVVQIMALLVVAVGIVLVENVARVFGLAAALRYAGLDLTEGWRHAAFGLLLFAVSLAFIFSADQLLAFLWPSGSWISKRRWQRQRRHGTAARVAAAVRSVAQPGSQRTASRLLLPMAIAFALLGLVQLTWMPSRAEQLAQMLTRNPLDLPEFGLDAVPGQWQGWQRQEFQVEHRVMDDPMGEVSQMWTFQRDNITCVLSLDYPYTQAHDLTSCYRATGWTIDHRTILSAGQDTGQPYAVAQMSRQLHGPRLLCYSLYDTAGTCDVRFKEELSLAELFEKRTDFGRPWFQIQVIALGPPKFSPEQEEQVAQFFLHMRGLLKQKCLETL